MAQTSYVYILWLVILAAGLWLIIGFGSTLLHAREDLAGEWELTPARHLADGIPTKMKVEQSGRFFKITLPHGKPIDLKIVEESIIDLRFGEHKRIVLKGNGAQVTFEGVAKGDLWRLSVEGAAARGADHRFIARLTQRLYPRPAAATRPSYAKVAHAR